MQFSNKPVKPITKSSGARKQLRNLPGGGKVRHARSKFTETHYHSALHSPVLTEGYAQYPACGQVIPGSSWMPTSRRGETQGKPINLTRSLVGTGGAPSEYARESGRITERWLPNLTREESKGLNSKEKIQARELKRAGIIPRVWARRVGKSAS